MAAAQKPAETPAGDPVVVVVPKRYVVKSVLVTVLMEDGKRREFYRYAPLPAGVRQASIDHLLSLGMIAEAD